MEDFRFPNTSTSFITTIRYDPEPEAVPDPERESEPEMILTYAARKYYDTTLHSLIFAFGTLGAITNSINIRVFVRQGLTSDSSTVCLFALAVSDLLACLVLVPWSFCDVVKFTAPTFQHVGCLYVVGLVFGTPHTVMYRITCWVTVYIAVERYLCVLMPFRVKRFQSPRLAAVAMTSVYSVIGAAYLAWFANVRLRVAFSTTANRTVIAIHSNDVARVLESYLNLIFDGTLSPAAVGIVALTTGLMLLKLRKYKKWREKSVSAASSVATSSSSAAAARGKSADGGAGTGSGGGAGAGKKSEVGQEKEIRMLKLVLMITGLFTVCSAMSLLPGVAAAFVPGFGFNGINVNLYSVLYQLRFVFDLVNASLNFFFYIRISTRYKAAFNEVFATNIA